VRSAVAAGVGRWRLRGDDLERPFHGVRTATPASNALERAAAYATRMPAAQAFFGPTAAAIHGMPVPNRALEGPIHVSTGARGPFPRARGIIGHRRPPSRRVANAGRLSLRASTPIGTWVELVGFVSHVDLVAAGDFLVTGRGLFDRSAPLATLEQLRAAVDERAGRRGIHELRAALADVRQGSISPKETELRLAMIAAGLPEPELNHRVEKPDGSTLAVIDLAYRRAKVGVEYEGAHHFTVDGVRSDIHRYELLADAGWLIVRVTNDDLTQRRAETMERIAQRLRSRDAL